MVFKHAQWLGAPKTGGATDAVPRYVKMPFYRVYFIAPGEDNT